MVFVFGSTFALALALACFLLQFIRALCARNLASNQCQSMELVDEPNVGSIRPDELLEAQIRKLHRPIDGGLFVMFVEWPRQLGPVRVWRL